ncbi:MAG TPA: dTMP kinase [Clostridiaceae bacterium]|nr:dTMP kinase [Clostridiaceae bacterium]
MSNKKSFYGRGLPNINPDELTGKLIIIEGPDCSGRSTHVELLKEWLEFKGYAVLNTGLSRSTLVGDAIKKAKQGNILGKTTLSLLYCTDFADQLENKIIPALRAGFIVLGDRYIFTLMARDIVRGASKEWLKELLEFALVPDIVFYLNVCPETLLHRAFSKYGQLDYWESGMDANFSSDMLESFIKYHNALQQEYEIMAKEYNFKIINGEDSIESVQNQFRRAIAEYLNIY